MDLLRSRTSLRRLKLGDLFHLLFNLGLAALVYLLVAVWQLYTLAFILVMISKWRIFAVQPRFWFANIVANLVDIIVGLSVLVFIYQASSAAWLQVVWAVLYAIWLTVVKPQSGIRGVTFQAAVGQFVGLTALFWYASSIPDTLVVGGAWLVSYAAARQLISAYEEDLVDLLSAIWALFVAQLTWFFNRWVDVFAFPPSSNGQPSHAYFIIPQAAVVMIVVGFGAAHFYDAAKNNKLGSRRTNYTFGFTAILLLLVLVVSKWNSLT
ncbi:MAG TPA: hypothetical protein VGS28_02040 [Candidatus Saccharimonadales bacterium]|nr:hypothetical protein [Candidatus Saccharimonadales bacterium]